MGTRWIKPKGAIRIVDVVDTTAAGRTVDIGGIVNLQPLDLIVDRERIALVLDVDRFGHVCIAGPDVTAAAIRALEDVRPAFSFPSELGGKRRKAKRRVIRGMRMIAERLACR